MRISALKSPGCYDNERKNTEADSQVSVPGGRGWVSRLTTGPRVSRKGDQFKPHKPWLCGLRRMSAPL